MMRLRENIMYFISLPQTFNFNEKRQDYKRDKSVTIVIFYIVRIHRKYSI